MKRIIVNVLFIIFSASGMEKLPQGPTSVQESIPESISTDYAHEEARYKKYPLTDLQLMSNFLQKGLKKSDDLIAYLATLQRFASKLVIQQAAMQNSAYENYIGSKFRNIYDANVEIMIKSGNEFAYSKYGGKEEKFILNPQTDEQLNEIIAHESILITTDFDLDKRKVIYSWILDGTKGQWLNSLGQARRLVAGQTLIRKELPQYQDLYPQYHHLACWLSEAKEPLLIKENVSFLVRFCDILETHAQQLRKMEIRGHQIKGVELTKKDFEKKLTQLLLLYEKVASRYAQLYKSVRDEMKKTTIELLQQKKGDIAFIKSLSRFKLLSPLTEEQQKNPEILPLILQLQERNLLPQDLPDELPAWVIPASKIAFPTYDKEFQEFKAEWDKAHPEIDKPTVSKKPKQKKVRKYKKASEAGVLPSAKEAEEDIEEQEEEIQQLKIKQAADGSYIEEGGNNDLNITIHNPKNKTTEILYKSDREKLKKQQEIRGEFLKKYYPPRYTQWVSMWATDPQEALEKQGYKSVSAGNKKLTDPKDYPKVIAYHDFSILVDEFIPEWGIINRTPSRRDKAKKHFLITIPGKMILESYPVNSKEREETGIYSYLIDTDNGEWYHRMFEPKSGKQLLQELLEQEYYSPQMTGIYDVYFPPLPSKSK